MLFAFPAQAQQVSGAVGVFCDTREQVESFVSLVQKGKTGEEAVSEVNKAAGKETACGMLQAYVVVLGIEEKKGYSVAHVMVVGVMLPQGATHVPPMEQFFALSVDVKPVVNI